MNGLAQITNWLPVLFVIIAGLVIIGFIAERIKIIYSYEVLKTKLTILQGNTLQILPTIPENSIDLVITSPPYSV